MNGIPSFQYSAVSTPEGELTDIWRDVLEQLLQALRGFAFPNVVTGTTQVASPNNSYVATSGAQTVFTLPTVANLGDFIQVIGTTTGGWRVSQNAGQSVQFGALTTTPGVTGHLNGTTKGVCALLYCFNPNTNFIVLNHEGTLTVT